MDVFPIITLAAPTMYFVQSGSDPRALRHILPIGIIIEHSQLCVKPSTLFHRQAPLPCCPATHWIKLPHGAFDRLNQTPPGQRICCEKMKFEPALGLRETNKIEKLQRIRDATKALFIQKGFDDTTTREIALMANVGIGTVFTYADNKRDLLFLIANDDLDRMAAKGEEACRTDVSCLENLMQFFGQHYEFFAKQPEISRMMLREMTFYDSGRQARRFQMIRERNIRTIVRIAKIGIDNGEVRTSESPETLGWLAFCIFQVELRQWLKAERPSVTVGMRRLMDSLCLCIKGWNPTAAAFRRSTAQPKIARSPKRKRVSGR